MRLLVAGSHVAVDRRRRMDESVLPPNEIV
jgi:hypothetical protein